MNNTILPREMTKAEFKKKIKGRFFSATFIKVNGERRTYETVKLGVPRNYVLQGGKTSHTHTSDTHLLVHLPNEREKHGKRKGQPCIRTLAMDRIVELKCGKDVYKIRHEEVNKECEI